MEISQKTLYEWVAKAKIPHYKLNGNIRFDEDVLQSWIEKRRVRVKQIV